MFGKTVSYQFQNVQPAHKHDGAELLAGHAVRDITPPPGMPKAGYSSNAHNGKGFRTRLKARVIYLRSHGQALAFVQLDALGGSLIVRLEVLKRIAEHTDIGPEGLVIGATHTHAGAGQYSASNFYNRFASNKSGFEPRYFDFLCQQIAEAVIDAYRRARPAKVASGCIEVWGQTRNRSLIPHHKNQHRLVKEPLNHAKFYAINPRLNMLRVDALHDDGNYYPLGAISTFSIHGTGISQHEDEYNADVWGYIERELEQGVLNSYNPPWQPVHAAVEGTHGDMAPAIRYGAAGYLEARRVGQAIGQQALSLFKSLDGQLQAQASVVCALRIIDLFQPQYALPKPAVGAALLAGAQENMTPVIKYLPPFKAGLGIGKTTTEIHGNKHRLLPEALRNLVLPEDEFPHFLTLHIWQVGHFAFVGLPFEITVQAGRNIEAGLRAVLPPSALIAISSVCNDYFGYCTTADEYACQYYEGGHTLYGPESNAFLVRQMAQLGDELQRRGSFCDQPAQWSFLFQRGDYMPESQPARGSRYVVQQPVYIDAEGLHEGYWQMQWQDVNSSQINWHQPLVTVQYSDDGLDWQTLTDDEGYDISVRWQQTARIGMAVYESRWYNPQFFGKRCYRFVVAVRGRNPVLYSEVFGGNILAE